MNGEVGGCGGGDVVVAIVVAALVACGVAACVCVCVCAPEQRQQRVL